MMMIRNLMALGTTGTLELGLVAAEITYLLGGTD
jgi:hypothetical protein